MFLDTKGLIVADAQLLFDEHRDGVFRYLCRVVGQAETARDLTQEVFLRVSRATVPDADAHGRRAWVFKIARNLALNHKRDTRFEALDLARATASRTLAEAHPDDDRTDGVSPAVQELRVAIDQALAALQELDRDVFLLRESGGLTYEEIATTCELSVEAVRARLRRARQELRSSLDGVIRTHRDRPVRLR